jgi:hypothetical protein
MKQAVKFLSKIAQLVLVACVVFVTPAIVHCIVTFTFSHYMNDLSSTIYCGLMSFISLIVTVFYIAIEAERIEDKPSNF